MELESKIREPMTSLALPQVPLSSGLDVTIWKF